jgi:hypothetical protein
MPLTDYTMLDAKQLAEKWSLPESWIRNQTRKSCLDPIPHVKVGKYVRFEWPGRKLYLWWTRHRHDGLDGQPVKPEPKRIVRPALLKRKAGL